VTTKTTARRAAKSPWLAVLARIGFLSRALTYVVVAILAAQVALGDRSESVDRKGALQTIGDQPFGRLLLIALAVGFAGYALWRLGRAGFPPPEDAGHPSRRWASVGSALVYGGVFMVTVRLLTGLDEEKGGDPTETLMGLPFGPWLVGAVGVGLFASAAWSVRRALLEKYRRNLRRLPAKAMPWADASAKGGLFARAAGHALIGGFLLRAAWHSDSSESVGLDGALRAVGDKPLGDVFLFAIAAGYLARAAFSVFEAKYRKGT
jgi:hypothetical protein